MNIFKVFRETIPKAKEVDGKIEYCQRCGTWLSHIKKEIEYQNDNAGWRYKSEIIKRQKNYSKQWITENGLYFNVCPECYKKLVEGKILKMDIHLIDYELYKIIYKLYNTRKEKIYDYLGEYQERLERSNN